MNQVLVVDPRKCTNCRMCELSCSMVKTGEFNPDRSRIRVSAFPKDFAYVPLACMQCGDAPCVEVCPSGSLTHKAGLVHHNDETCIGCRMCMLACPFGVISYDASKGIVAKCDTCDGKPECAQFCPTGAIEFKATEMPEMAKSKDFARKLAEALKSAASTEAAS